MPPPAKPQNQLLLAGLPFLLLRNCGTITSAPYKILQNPLTGSGTPLFIAIRPSPALSERRIASAPGIVNPITEQTILSLARSLRSA
jgi:hypothetical protein